ncbi:MAG TPA: radical SAM protein, partial [Candidatus Methylomirabilis sp.]|nr:radical SAM protein [Candidatus Methylomirabilis sp.]
SCGYCPLRAERHVRRAALTPEEVGQAFIGLHRRGLASGLFLTSGIPGAPVRMMDRMLAAAEWLRRRHGYRGYLHLKLLPGVEPAQVETAARLASRLSVNLEAPNDHYLARLAPEKTLEDDLLPLLRRAGTLSRTAREEGRPAAATPAGITTQFVVGAAGESDQDVLGLVAGLERERLLHHAHFSHFVPVADTPLDSLPEAPAAREIRLYQAEHLLREYGFGTADLPFDAAGNLPLERDPKAAWAAAHPEVFPVDLLTAPREALLKVPGVGPGVAGRLLATRRRVCPRDARDLARLGLRMAAAGPYVTLGGRPLAAPHTGRRQLRLPLATPHVPGPPRRTDTPPCAFR